jgi:hypothetical protein
MAHETLGSVYQNIQIPLQITYVHVGIYSTSPIKYIQILKTGIYKS